VLHIETVFIYLTVFQVQILCTDFKATVFGIYTKFRYKFYFLTHLFNIVTLHKGLNKCFNILQSGRCNELC